MSMKKIFPFCLLLLFLAGCGSPAAEGSLPPPVSDPVPVQTTPPARTPAPLPTATVPLSAEPPAPSETAPSATATAPASAPVPPAETPAPSPTAPPPAVSAPPTPTPAPTQEPTPAPTPSATPSAAPVPTPAPPSDEQVTEAYRRAEEAYGWFESAPLPTGDEVREVGGVVYKKVDYPGLSNLDELRAYLRGLFSDEIVDTLLPVDGGRYVDLDGALFVMDADSPAPSARGGETRQVIRESAEKRSVKVTVDALDPQSGAVIGTETYTFPYERVGEKWIFTSFSLT